MKTIRLLHKHTHEGKTYQAGETITLPDETVEWLLQFEHGYRAQLIEQHEEFQALTQPPASTAADDDR